MFSRWRTALATAYSISEALGIREGVSRSSEAPAFPSSVHFSYCVGQQCRDPGSDDSRYARTTVSNGVLLPIILFAVLKLVNDRE